MLLLICLELDLSSWWLQNFGSIFTRLSWITGGWSLWPEGTLPKTGNALQSETVQHKVMKTEVAFCHFEVTKKKNFLYSYSLLFLLEASKLKTTTINSCHLVSTSDIGVEPWSRIDILLLPMWVWLGHAHLLPKHVGSAVVHPTFLALLPLQSSDR